MSDEEEDRLSIDFSDAEPDSPHISIDIDSPSPKKHEFKGKLPWLKPYYDKYIGQSSVDFEDDYPDEGHDAQVRAMLDREESTIAEKYGEDALTRVAPYIQGGLHALPFIGALGAMTYKYYNPDEVENKLPNFDENYQRAEEFEEGIGGMHVIN